MSLAPTTATAHPKVHISLWSNVILLHCPRRSIGVALFKPAFIILSTSPATEGHAPMDGKLNLAQPNISEGLKSTVVFTL